MLCNNCNKREANTHIKESINGELREYYLCKTCAHSLGYTSIETGFSLDFDDFFGSVLTKKNFSSAKPITEEKCESCGATFDYMVKSGKAGCANCYSKFSGRLAPSIRQIHGNTAHTGKIPASAGEALKLKRTVDKLKAQLNSAVNNQEYEEAARIRDAIKELEMRN